MFADVHIGEADFTLGRDAEFEIPYLRAQLVKHQQQLTDNERRQADYLKSAANAQTQYAQVGLMSRMIVPLIPAWMDYAAATRAAISAMQPQDCGANHC